MAESKLRIVLDVEDWFAVAKEQEHPLVLSIIFGNLETEFANWIFRYRARRKHQTCLGGSWIRKLSIFWIVCTPFLKIPCQMT